MNEEKAKLARRDFLRMAALAAAGTAAVACQPQTVIVKETVEVEKEVVVTQVVEVEKEVTKLVAGTPVVEKVVETKVVEKVVTPTAVPPTATPELTEEEQWRRETLIIPGTPGAAAEVCNPMVPGASTMGLLYGLGFEELWLINFETGETTPWLAEVSVPDLEWNDDYTEVDVPLRKGIEWSDGEPFTAEDVAFSLNMVRDNLGMRYGATMAEWLKEAEAVDDFTVHITLNKPNPRFLHHNFTARICSSFIVLPKHIFQDVEDPLTFQFWDPDKGWPVMTGPYRLTKSTETERIFERRDDWWGAKTGFRNLPAPKRVVYIPVDTREKGAAMLESDEIDYYGGLEFSTYVVLKQKRPDMVSFDPNPPYEWMDPCPWNLGFNCGREPWNDREMRWAVAYGIEQERLAKIVHGGFGTVARNTYPPYPVVKKFTDPLEDLFDKYDCTVYDPNKAKEIIESKGWVMGDDGIYVKDGQRFEAEFIATPAAITTAQATMISAMLREIGIDAPPKFMTSSAYWDRKPAREYDLECSWTVCGSVADPYAEMDQFLCKWVKPEGEPGQNWGYCNPEFDKLVEEMGMIPPGGEGLIEKFREVMEVWLQDLPVVPLDQSARILAFNPTYWKNWSTTENGNNYVQPPPWWQQFIEVMCRIEPA